jgi:hypothetical protein
MTKEQIKSIEDKVVAELGNEFDVDMLSCTLSEMNLTDNDAFICAGYFLGDIYDTFEYNGKVLADLPVEAQHIILHNVIALKD